MHSSQTRLRCKTFTSRINKMENQRPWHIAFWGAPGLLSLRTLLAIHGIIAPSCWHRSSGMSMTLEKSCRRKMCKASVAAFHVTDLGLPARPVLI